MPKSRNNKQRQSPPQRNGLGGWLFLIIEGNGISASGQILGTIGTHHVVQFQGVPSYTRVMSPEQIGILTLFQSEDERMLFLQQWQAENTPPTPDEVEVDGPDEQSQEESPPEEGPDAYAPDVDPEDPPVHEDSSEVA